MKLTHLPSLAIADFIVGVYSIPFFTIQFIENKWLFSRGLCDAWLSVDYVASNASVMNLLAISVDRSVTNPNSKTNQPEAVDDPSPRYFSVTRPLSYRARRTTRKAALMILSAWGLSLVCNNYDTQWGFP